MNYPWSSPAPSKRAKKREYDALHYAKNRRKRREQSAAYYVAHKDERQAYALEYRAKNLTVVRQKSAAYGKASRRKDPRGKMLESARRRAKKHGLAFTIDADDFTVPKLCPLLGIELRIGDGAVHAGSPSLDRKIPSLGYIPGNVWVISMRANVIKQDATANELLRIGQALRDAGL